MEIGAAVNNSASTVARLALIKDTKFDWVTRGQKTIFDQTQLD
jgi:hypothetical protein